MALGAQSQPGGTLNFLNLLAILLLSASPMGGGVVEEWCVADPQAPGNMLQGALDWACGAGGADCGAIQVNQACYWPNTLPAHASFAFNSYWQKFKHQGASCYFNAAAIITENNPSDLFGSIPSLCIWVPHTRLCSFLQNSSYCNLSTWNGFHSGMMAHFGVVLGTWQVTVAVSTCSCHKWPGVEGAKLQVLAVGDEIYEL